MVETMLYPLRLAPIYQYRLWGGRRLAALLGAPLPSNGPVGEAWVFSDRDEHASRIADGPLAGRTIRSVMVPSQEPLMGKLAGRFERFPLLLKFLDAHEMLSVQVHPGYPGAGALLADETAKTEAWVVLEASPGSRIYAGLQPGATADTLRHSIANATLAEQLVSIQPKPGNAVFIPAGTVHSLGGDVVVFEVQQNSDTTFRLYDWGHVDAKTGQGRALQVESALACTDFVGGAAGLIQPPVEAAGPGSRERLFDCDAFQLWRLHGASPFTVGAHNVPRVLVCIEGTGQIVNAGNEYTIRKGEVWLLPAVVGVCIVHPGIAMVLLEIAIPETTKR